MIGTVIFAGGGIEEARIGSSSCSKSAAIASSAAMNGGRLGDSVGMRWKTCWYVIGSRSVLSTEHLCRHYGERGEGWTCRSGVEARTSSRRRIYIYIDTTGIHGL